MISSSSVARLKRRDGRINIFLSKPSLPSWETVLAQMQVVEEDSCTKIKLGQTKSQSRRLGIGCELLLSTWIPAQICLYCGRCLFLFWCTHPLLPTPSSPLHFPISSISHHSPVFQLVIPLHLRWVEDTIETWIGPGTVKCRLHKLELHYAHSLFWESQRELNMNFCFAASIRGQPDSRSFYLWVCFSLRQFWERSGLALDWLWVTSSL